MRQAAGAEASSYDPIGRLLAERRATITFCLTSAVAYARLHLSVDDDQRETGRNQPPKPEWPSESTTYVFACVVPSRRPQRGQGRYPNQIFCSVQNDLSSRAQARDLLFLAPGEESCH